jgi:hypothetical protein
MGYVAPSRASCTRWGRTRGWSWTDMGHKDPDLALTVYRQSVRRDEGEHEARALVEGAPIGSNGSDAASEPATDAMGQAQ